MYIVDFYPSRDQFEEWAHEVIGRRMHIAINIEQIKVLACYTFLVVVCNPPDQRAILLEPYWYMRRKMIMTHPWTANFDAKEMSSAKAPVWIDLSLLNPTFELYTNQMLSKVGKVLYAHITLARSKFSHIRGCVLCNLNDDLVEFINLSIPNVANFRVDVLYQTLSDACFAYKHTYCKTLPTQVAQEKKPVREPRRNQGMKNYPNNKTAL